MIFAARRARNSYFLTFDIEMARIVGISPHKTRKRLFYITTTVAVDGLVTQWAKPSTAMVLTVIFGNIPVLAPKGLKLSGKESSQMKIRRTWLDCVSYNGLAMLLSIICIWNVSGRSEPALVCVLWLPLLEQDSHISNLVIYRKLCYWKYWRNIWDFAGTP